MWRCDRSGDIYNVTIQPFLFLELSFRRGVVPWGFLVVGRVSVVGPPVRVRVGF